MNQALGKCRQTAEKWRPIILDFKSRHNYPNPFLDVSIKAVFTGPSGRSIEREAYWDGGDSYRISFAPTEVGNWSYKIQAPEATGLQGQCGMVECVEYTGKLAIYQHGFLRVHQNGRYLIYHDGTPFFWLGDTHWEFSYKEKWEESNHPEMASMFKGMAERRAAQGYNVYQTNLRSDSIMGGDKKYWDESNKGDLPNVSFYQKELDRRMYYLADLGLVNALGQAWFMSIAEGVVHQKHLARYIIARYGALPTVWTLAGEVAGYTGGKDRNRNINDWREVARYIEKMDGYGHLQTAHYTNERPFADYYQDEDWFDFTLNQAGHGDYPISANHYREYLQKYSGKPFIEGEALYEYCSTLEEMGTRLCTADMLRRVAYMSIQLGGCGYTYGAQGIWDNVWEKNQANAMRLFNRFDITWYEAIDGPGGVQMGYMKEFYEKVHFWEMLPYAGDTHKVDNQLFGEKVPFATISEDAKRIVLYYGDGARKPCKLTGLNLATYQMMWFDPKKGTYLQNAEQFQPKEGVWETPEKPGEGDWLLVAEEI